MNEVPANRKPAKARPTAEELERRRSVVPILITMGVALALLVGSVLGALATAEVWMRGRIPRLSSFPVASYSFSRCCCYRLPGWCCR